jgi:hypothetical protein
MANSRSNSFAIAKVSTELLFIVLPFIIVGIVLYYRGSTTHLLYIPEWAIAATVLQGQVLVKFITTLFVVSKEDGFNLDTARGSFIFTILLTFCFVPTILVLVFVFLSEVPSFNLAILQIISFIVAVLVFFGVAFLLESVDFDAREKLGKKVASKAV